MEYFGWVGTILFMICYVPQIYTTKKARDVSSMSLPMWLIQWAAYSSCLVYAVSIMSEPLMFGYSMGWLLTAWELDLMRQFRCEINTPSYSYAIYRFSKRK